MNTPLKTLKAAHEYLVEVHGLTLSIRTLSDFRSQGRGPAYTKICGRVYYAASDLDAWVCRQKSENYVETAAAE